ncbi:MAG: type II toxin-antitoxin system PemK/MazF family toxin [Blastocatellia bacterium]|nr:type II toxin-antitoxin system PemK/MazF family toxin [Blastocatellia bacterium]
MANPSRGEIWLAELDPARGHEQAGTRPCLIVSDDRLNHGPSGLVIVVPVTSRKKGIPSHVEITPPEGGLNVQSFVKCEDVRSISKERLLQRWGVVSSKTTTAVEDRLRILLAL